MIDEIKTKIRLGQYEFSAHALTRSVQRTILVDELVEAVDAGSIIELYPNDRYGPSCLVSGTTKAGRPLHVQCSFPTRPLLKIITVYQPTLDKWEANFNVRK